MFACVALMIFSKLNGFQNFFIILLMFFEASLGSWSMDIYRGTDQNGVELENLFLIGVLFHCTFLLVNMVLFLNFVIAILSSTFAYYETK